MKKGSVWACTQCGTQHPKWAGKCPDCGAWNSLSEEPEMGALRGKGMSATLRQTGVGDARPITDVNRADVQRLFTGVSELDRVLGGGLVPGSLVLLGGDPGVGKSTLFLQAMFCLAVRGYKVLYISGEESAAQIRLRAERLEKLHPNILVSNEILLDVALPHARQLRPQVLVIDSIQTVHSSAHPGSPGSVGQVKECTGALLEFAKTENIPTFLVGHVTKESGIAGPRLLEHLVDTVMYLEGDATSGFRILRAIKNRFGSTGEIGIFAMQGQGLVDVPNPSLLFLEGHREDLEGNAIAVSMEGTRPVLVEVQALVGRTTFATPRRTVTGLDANRFSILVAVLEKRAGLVLSQNDIYATVAGGLRLSEPASDLALAAAVSSSLLGKPVPPRSVFLGEVGLSGEVRPCTHLVARVQEAVKLGFESVFLPERSWKSDRESLLRALGDTEARIHPVGSVQDVVFLHP